MPMTRSIQNAGPFGITIRWPMGLIFCHTSATNVRLFFPVGISRFSRLVLKLSNSPLLRAEPRKFEGKR
jgi:hypothetical protein